MIRRYALWIFVSTGSTAADVQKRRVRDPCVSTGGRSVLPDLATMLEDLARRTLFWVRSRGRSLRGVDALCRTTKSAEVWFSKARKSATEFPSKRWNDRFGANSPVATTNWFWPVSDVQPTAFCRPTAVVRDCPLSGIATSPGPQMPVRGRPLRDRIDAKLADAVPAKRVPDSHVDQCSNWEASAPSPLCLPSPSHGLDGQASAGSPKTVTLTRPSSRCPTVDCPQARLPTASPAPAGQPDTAS